jgi:hypothetical protein
MKSYPAWACALMLLVAIPARVGFSQKQPPSFAITGPTIIAFFSPATQNQADDNEAFSDFQFHFSKFESPLKRAGITLCRADAHSFRVRNAGRSQTFWPGKIGVGYYLVAPGMAPQIEYGVMTDADLLEIARKYFGRAIE